MRFYVSLFPNSHIIHSSPMIVSAHIHGQDVMALNGGPSHELTEAFSFFVECADQGEVDHYWNAFLVDGGAPNRCGWLKDRYGLAWQIIPKLLGELMSDEDEVKADRVMQAMLGMQKIDCAELQRAYDGG
jgi:predicted 3-demethylubiquinone-9 3-methyltransferase (glyoxalase superfamily)